jgi:hypothetical protein
MSVSSSIPSRTCFSNPFNISQAFFTKNSDFAIVEWAPDKHSETIVNGPASLGFYPALRKAGITEADCVLFHPKKDGEAPTAYLFSKEVFCTIRFDSCEWTLVPESRSASASDSAYVMSVTELAVTSGPSPISSWKTFTQGGFTSIDAALTVPNVPNEAYFFSGTRYMRVYFVPGTLHPFHQAKLTSFADLLIEFLLHSQLGTSEERITYGPKPFQEQWKALKDAKFDTIDCILPHPTEPYHAYFFSGDKYCHIEFKPSA